VSVAGGRPSVRVGAVAGRLYCDYLRPDRLDAMRDLLGAALEHRYRSMTLAQFMERVGRAAVGPDERVLLLRHDIDSDPGRARRMSLLERELGLTGSYFFRRSTRDIGLMRELASAGFEVGYHYEELATVVKERGVRTAAEARQLVDTGRARLRASLDELRDASGLPLDVLAAHGDFANRFVGVSNEELLADRDFRAAIGVRLEAYDVAPHVDARYADGAGRGRWSPRDPTEAIRAGAPVVELLWHPRAWGAAPVCNARIDLDRVREGAAYRVRRARRRDR
jgi:hypothetical protein